MGLKLGRFVLQTFLKDLGFDKTSSTSRRGFGKVWDNNGVKIR